jgi:RNA polymerase sigma-70 factor (ECF subfamily)
MDFVETASHSKESISNATRASLISRVRCQESRAWDELVELYGPLIAHWCYRFELDSHSAADCIQDVFAAVSRALPTYDAKKSHGAFRSWLWTITRNKIYDQLRRNRLSSLPQGGTSAMKKLKEIPDLQDSDAEPSSAAELKSLVSRALDQIRCEFEPRSLEIFMRSVIDQVATDLVAVEFKIQSASVRQVRSRILRRLRQQLGDIEH